MDSDAADSHLPTANGGGGGCNPSRQRSACIRTSGRAHLQHTTESAKSVFIAVNASLRWLNTVKCLLIFVIPASDKWSIIDKSGFSCCLFALKVHRCRTNCPRVSLSPVRVGSKGLDHTHRWPSGLARAGFSYLTLFCALFLAPFSLSLYLTKIDLLNRYPKATQVGSGSLWSNWNRIRNKLSQFRIRDPRPDLQLCHKNLYNSSCQVIL